MRETHGGKRMDWSKLRKVISQRQLAIRLGVTPMAVSQWKRRGKIPGKYVLQIERITRGAISRFEMRPDLYPLERIDRAA